MKQHQELLILYMEEKAKAKNFETQLTELIEKFRNLELQFTEEKEKFSLEHRRFVRSKDVIKEQEMQIQKLNIKYEIDTIELKRIHDEEI